MSPEKQREIASKGGRAAHQKGTAHEWSSDEAREAGRKGGMASRGGRGKLPVNSSVDESIESLPPEPAAERAASTQANCRLEIACRQRSGETRMIRSRK